MSSAADLGATVINISTVACLPVGSDLDDLHPVVNAALRGIIVAERYLPVRQLPGVSLLVRARPRA